MLMIDGCVAVVLAVVLAMVLVVVARCGFCRKSPFTFRLCGGLRAAQAHRTPQRN